MLSKGAQRQEKIDGMSNAKSKPAGKLAMKRKSFLLCWLLLATPAVVEAQFNYTVTNQTVTITGYSGTNSVLAVPSTIDGLPVTSIGVSAFFLSSITSITIPNSVTTISDGAFSGCRSLTNITIPNSVTNIGEYAFSDSGLTSITIPSSVTTISAAAFSGCRMTDITIPNNVTSIGEYAFYYSGLASITIPSSVTSIGEGAFDHCSSLANITIPNSVTNIGDSAFYL